MQSFLKLLRSKIGMQGWVTWLASTGLIVLGLLRIYHGDLTTGLTLITTACGFVGIGRKIEKK